MAAQATERNELVVQQAAITILLGALGNTSATTIISRR